MQRKRGSMGSFAPLFPSITPSRSLFSILFISFTSPFSCFPFSKSGHDREPLTKTGMLYRREAVNTLYSTRISVTYIYIYVHYLCETMRSTHLKRYPEWQSERRVYVYFERKGGRRIHTPR